MVWAQKGPSRAPLQPACEMLRACNSRAENQRPGIVINCRVAAHALRLGGASHPEWGDTMVATQCARIADAAGPTTRSSE